MTTDELNIKITADTSDVSDKMKRAAKDVEDLGSSAKKSAGSEKESAEAMNSMATSAQLVAQAASQLVLSFNNLQSTVNGVSTGFGAISAATTQLAAAIPTAASGLTNIGAAASEAEKEIKDTGNEIEALGDAANRAAPQIEDMGDETEQAGEEAKKAKTKFKDFGDTANNLSFTKLKSTLLSLGLGQILKSSLTNAMNAVESESLFETSMGGYANEARAWSQELSSSLGLDPYALRKNVGVLYSMTTSMGLAKDTSYQLSTGLARLGEDMASFYNLSSAEAFDKLRSGITGETEPLKQLGIILDEATVKQYAYQTGIAEAGTELSNQQKVLARYQTILAQTSNAQGDLSRTLNSPANQLRMTLNDLQNASTEFGMALMPVVQTTLPILRQGISDLAPVVTSLASGVATVGSALQLLENPAVRGIAYAGAAAVAVRKLNMAVGSTASGLILLGGILTFILGKYAESQKQTEEQIESGMNGAGDAANYASISTDKLTDSLGEATAAAARLAGFDEITKLSGGGSGSTLASQIASAEDIANIYGASDAIASYNDAFGNVDSNFDIGLGKINWEEFKKDAEALWEDIVKVFGNSETESYQALSRLNERVKDLFGEDFTTFWEGVGADINKAFTGTEDERYQALYDLNERLKQLPFGEIFTDTFKKLGESLYDVTEGLEKIKNGDFSGAMDDFADAVSKNKDLFDFAAKFTISGSTDVSTEKVEKLKQNIASNKVFGALSWLTSTGVPSNSSTDNVASESGFGNMVRNKFSQNDLFSPVTDKDLYTILKQSQSSRSGAGGVFEIHNTIELDGEPIKQWTRTWQADDTANTNGRQ